jgi:ergothioneine biosynthesis protein EgtB
LVAGEVQLSISHTEFDALSDTNTRPHDLVERYRQVRQLSETLCATLEPEDCCIQSMPDASPTRWHLAHTTWFFETFVLSLDAAYRPREGSYRYLFNSYYDAVGQQFPRAQRGLLSRPTVGEVFGYRREIDQLVVSACERQVGESAELWRNLELGLHHEQQHQELILTDIKHAFSCNPLFPVYRTGTFRAARSDTAPAWTSFPGGLHSIGHDGDAFAFDNERPRHRVFLEDFELADRLVTCGEFLEFIEDGGYRRPELWLSEGWQHANEQEWRAPLYWMEHDGQWQEFTLGGVTPIDPRRPVAHVSYFEADAYARWAGARLATEVEWELAAGTIPLEGCFADSLLGADAAIHPAPAGGTERPAQMFGSLWQWTSSAYAAYPGFAAARGALGEYNGKFMCNQYVLRGGSCATPSGHIRATYRNFFPAAARWQFSGIRLAR